MAGTPEPMSITAPGEHSWYDDMLDVIAPPAWMRDAACVEYPELSFFDGPTAPAKAVCARCLVRDECESYAREHGIGWGVWGGLDDKERRSTR